MGRQYLDRSGRRVFVRQGIGSPTVYFTGVAVARNRSKRYKSASVPARLTEAEAQADLDAMAARCGWREVIPCD